MIFVFPKDSDYAFWMKDMNFPLDMVWVSADFHVVGIEKNVMPGPMTYKIRISRKRSAEITSRSMSRASGRVCRRKIISKWEIKFLFQKKLCNFSFFIMKKWEKFAKGMDFPPKN